MSDHVTITRELVQTPARAAPHEWTVAHRKPAVVVAAFTAEGKLVLIRQKRIAIRETIWEVPAGQVDGHDSPEEIALRELREESGYELAPGGEILPLGDYFSSPGFTNEHGYFFVARPVQLSTDGHAHHETESIVGCRAFPADELWQMIARNEIRDANTLSICARLVAHRLLTR